VVNFKFTQQKLQWGVPLVLINDQDLKIASNSITFKSLFRILFELLDLLTEVGQNLRRLFL
jgi:hypothetical protein